jgi:hypothetical protein
LARSTFHRDSSDAGEKCAREEPFESLAGEVAVFGQKRHRPWGEQSNHNTVNEGQVIAGEKYWAFFGDIAATHNFRPK